MAQSTKPPGPITIKVFKIKLNYAVAVHQKAEGLPYVHPDLTSENFPEIGAGEREDEAIVINFGKCMETEEVLAQLEQMTLRAGTPSELADLHLSNSASDSELENCLPIIALGTVWTDHEPVPSRRVACLAVGTAGRGLGLAWLGSGWSSRYWILTFRKDQQLGTSVG